MVYAIMWTRNFLGKGLVTYQLCEFSKLSEKTSQLNFLWKHQTLFMEKLKLIRNYIRKTVISRLHGESPLLRLQILFPKVYSNFNSKVIYDQTQCHWMQCQKSMAEHKNYNRVGSYYLLFTEIEFLGIFSHIGKCWYHRSELYSKY